MNLHSEPDKDEERSRQQLAAAYSFLSELSDTSFESLLGGETILPPEYEKEVEEYSSVPIQQRIANWKRSVSASVIPPLPDKRNIAQQLGEAFEPIAKGIKKALSEFEIEFFVAAHLGDDVTGPENEALRVIPLIDPPGLRQRLPWLGHALRVYRQERHPDQITAKYIAFVETLEVEPTHQQGELKIVLETDHNKRSEVFLSFDYPACEFPISLPADEDQLVLECYADDVA